MGSTVATKQASGRVVFYSQRVPSKGPYFFFFRFFLMWSIFKVLIEFVTILLLLYGLVLRPGSMWDLSFPARD